MSENEHFQRYFGDVKRVGIYGAGHYGKLLFRLLSELGLDITAFFVDDFKSGKLCGTDIIKAPDIPTDTDLLVIALGDLQKASEIAYSVRRSGVSARSILLNNRLLDCLTALDGKDTNQPRRPFSNLFLKLRKSVQAFPDIKYLKFAMKRIFHSLLISYKILTNSNIRHRRDCPICGGKSHFLLSNLYGYRLHECERCTHVFVVNIPDASSLGRLYSGCDYFDIDRGHQGITVLTDDTQWSGFLSGRIKLINLFGLLNSFQKRPARILEIGCLEGRLLDWLKRGGHSVYGCEINKEVAALGSRTFGIEIRSAPLDRCGFENGFFDIVLAFHVFEHFDDPLMHLRACRRLLRKDGHILIEVPSGETDYDNLQHLHFFNERSLEVMFNSTFDEITIAPGWYHLFDTRYSQTAVVCARAL